MFFRKKSSDTKTTNVAKSGIKKMDAVVTWVILSGIIASIYGVKKLREKDSHEWNNGEKVHTPAESPPSHNSSHQ